MAILIGCTNSNSSSSSSSSSSLNANNSSSFSNTDSNAKNKKASKCNKRSKFEDVFFVILVPGKLFGYVLLVLFTLYIHKCNCIFLIE